MENLLEDLAELEHKQWSHWTKYMLNRLKQLENEQDAFDPYKVMHQKQNWHRQIATPYSKLTEKEKDSDRIWAAKSLEIIAKHLAELNPYPKDVFLPRSKDEMKTVADLIAKAGYSPDAIFGQFGRQVWNNAVQKLKELSEV
jgi:hypothetical protein